MMKNIYFNLATKGIAPTGLALSYDINLLLQKCCSYGAEFMVQISCRYKLVLQIYKCTAHMWHGLSYNLLQRCCAYGAEFMVQISYEDKLMNQISCGRNKYE